MSNNYSVGIMHALARAYGRTVNLASCISDRAAAGQVLVNELVVEMASMSDVRCDSIGPMELDGMPQPIELFEARPR